MSKYYTGIGSRQTPPDICQMMTDIALYLYSNGYILRSGGATGADSAFESGALDKKEIYLPWKKFNGNSSPLFNISEDAFKLASKFHPYWLNLKEGARRLHARNGYQVMGEDLKTPSEFVICWTKASLMAGGTAQAMRIAQANNIKIYNLAQEEDLDYWEEKMKMYLEFKKWKEE